MPKIKKIYKSVWSNGRAESNNFLWHQNILLCKNDSFEKISPQSTILLGFSSDEGVRRNLGRIGAFHAPNEIRKSLKNTVLRSTKKVYDLGNITVENPSELESRQLYLASQISKTLSINGFPVILGGGHETSYGHIKGVCETYPDKKIAIINFDAHLDLREYSSGGHSGSWAKQLLDEFNNISYLPIGVSRYSNIPSMFEFLKNKSMDYISIDDWLNSKRKKIRKKILKYISKHDIVSISIDLDVFSSGICPGVSAVNPNGVLLNNILPVLNDIISTKKAVSIDIVELNPTYDDGKSAKLASYLINYVLEMIDLMDN